MAKKQTDIDTQAGTAIVDPADAGRKSKFADRAKEVFKSYPQKNELYFTSDGLAFLQECDAKNHAAGLKDKTVKPIKKQ